MRDEKRCVRDFYEQYGWSRDAAGRYRDTADFVDVRPAMAAYHQRAMARLKRMLGARGGRLLDAGCGALASAEYAGLGAGFDKRVCVDFARAALLEARGKLGESGVFVQADVARLPFREGTFDAVLCAHVLYHLPPDEQAGAAREIHRALAEGGRAIIVYTWPDCLLTRLARWLNPRRIAPGIPGMRWVWRRFLKPRSAPAPPPAPDGGPPLFFAPQDYRWYRREIAHTLPVRLRCWEAVSLPFAQAFVTSGRLGRWTLRLFSLLERACPRLMGRIGAYPAFIVTKR